MSCRLAMDFHAYFSPDIQWAVIWSRKWQVSAEVRFRRRYAGSLRFVRRWIWVRARTLLNDAITISISGASFWGSMRDMHEKLSYFRNVIRATVSVRFEVFVNSTMPSPRRNLVIAMPRNIMKRRAPSAWWTKFACRYC